MLDDGWAAAATWDARLRTADDIIARAEDDRRAVALIPLSEDRATSRSSPRAPRACGSISSSRSRTRSTAPRRCLRCRAFSPMRAGCRTGLAVGRRRSRPWRPDFMKGLAQAIGQRPITVVTGGLAGPHALTAADNAAGALTVKVLRAQTTPPIPASCVRSISRACRSARRRSRSSPASAKPRRGSNCRSKSATISRASRLPASARRAPCNCSTSAGAGAPSASCPAPPPTSRSR